MNIVDETVAVVVEAVVGRFAGIGPDAVAQIGVRKVESAVDDGDYNRITG